MEALKKLVKVNESFTINRYDNGFMVEVGGRNKDDDWITVKIILTSMQEVHAIIDAITQLPKED